MAEGLHERIVREYAESQIVADTSCEDVKAACRRYLADREDPRWEFRPELPEFIIRVQESLFCHQQGEDLSGRPLRGKPFLLQPWQMFCVYNIGGFYHPGTELRRYQEALLELARKNGKTPFATSLIWALGL